MATTRTLDSAAAAATPAQARPSSSRLLSLDMLRGITICFMIMVNNNGGSGAWWFMEHAQWNGLTPTDLVFPTFLFIVGVSIVFSVESRLKRGATRGELARHTIGRAFVIFLLGLVVNGFPHFALAHYRIYGVLQRIAICYLVVGLFYLFDRRVSTKIAAILVCLIGYWILVQWVPVPGAGMPGKDVPLLDRDQNIVAWLDRQIMPGHLYEEWAATPQDNYTAHNTRDPEGLLSNIPAFGTALLGLLAGLWLRSQKSISQKGLGLLAASVCCLALGYLWNVWLPINKKMWTSSYVLAAAGYSLLVFTIAWFAVEQLGWGKGKSNWLVRPWLVFGSNAIVAYMFSELLAATLDSIHVGGGARPESLEGFLQLHVFAQIPDRGWGAFAYSVSFAIVCFIPVLILYRKKIFVKI
jgi:predicted acyltransferase